MLHAIRRWAKELLRGRSFRQLAQVRHDIAHGNVTNYSLSQAAQTALPDVQLCLVKAVLTVVDGSSRGSSLTAMVPRDFEIRPGARASFYSRVALGEFRPYLGTWVSLERGTDRSTRIGDEGSYVRREGVSVKWHFPRDDPRHPSSRYVDFKREGQSFRNLSGPGSKVVPRRDWRPPKLTAAWRREMQRGSSR